MGFSYAEIELSNPREPELRPLRVSALADTGAMMLCLPPRVSQRLDLQVADERDVTLADGRRVKVPYVGPIQVRFGTRFCFVGAFVMGDEVVLGAVPMEDMDLVVSPLTREVTVNPKHPDGPVARA
jgi:clan AA aspartic protease